MTGLREHALLELVDMLLAARRTCQPIPEVPVRLQPVDTEEVVFVQNTLAANYGPIGGWKVGASSADAVPACAPMPSAWMGSSGTLIKARRYRGVEAEIAFLLGQDLPARTAEYSREEALAAIAICAPAIEVLESCFTDPSAMPTLLPVADLQNHGAFLHGSPFDGWKDFDFSTEKVTLTVDGVVRVERTGSNPSGDLLRLVHWLANQSARTGGLRKGQWITTGSWTGNTLAGSNSRADADFGHAGHVDCCFED